MPARVPHTVHRLPPRPFREYLLHALGTAAAAPSLLLPDECQTSSSRTCTLCHASAISYPAEAATRDTAIHEFWDELHTAAPLRRLVRSPLGRHYRTTSKRKAFVRRDGVHLALIDPAELRSGNMMDVHQCAIEPTAHARCYQSVQNALRKPFASPLADVLRYVIIRGDYVAFTIILSVQFVDGKIIKAANTLSKGLSHAMPGIRGILLYEDDSDGRYYLGTRNPARRNAVRKLHGDAMIPAVFAGKRFLYAPIAFSQINASIVDLMLARCTELLRPDGNAALYDLYCGYGLFTLTVGAKARSATGMERTPEAVEAAQANARRQHATNARFVRCDITPRTLAPVIAPIRPADVVILDPPRGGTGAGVIETVAAKGPARVVHLFCNIDLLLHELARWREGGYRVVEAIPFDMFPGTDDVEVMVLLSSG
ncbi:MAG: methyltransferase domain-containing protein [Bacteroidota bacterium]